MPQNANKEETKVLSDMITALQQLDSEARQRIFRTLTTYFDDGAVVAPIEPEFVRGLEHRSQGSKTNVASYSENLAPTPKQFLLEKQPHTDVERIACLAYYLSHYRDTPYFKTLELSKMNTEAAQPKFSNAAYASHNAVKQGYLTSATKGNRQLSAAGEQFVSALPDREAARNAMTRARPRRKKKSSKRLSSGKKN